MLAVIAVSQPPLDGDRLFRFSDSSLSNLLWPNSLLRGEWIHAGHRLTRMRNDPEECFSCDA